MIRLNRRLLAASVAIGAAALIAPTVASAQSPGPSDRPGRSPDQAQRKAGCPAGPAVGVRVVHAEMKVQTKDGFEDLQADTGKITSADASRITLVRADGQSVNASKAEATRVCRNGRRATFEDLEVGDGAQVLRTTDGQLRLVRARSEDFKPERWPGNRPGPGPGRRTPKRV